MDESTTLKHQDLSQGSLRQRLQYYCNPFDGRYEDLKTGSLALNLFRDMMAGLIVAMVAIPLAMGFAMASGLQPEQGIVGGAVAGLMGALFGGSKYQVYGPTAAFIPIIAAIMSGYGYTLLVIASILAGLILVGMALMRWGRFVNLVPHSIVVGFTIGIAIVIASSQLAEVFGLKVALGYDFIEKIHGITLNFEDLNPYALLIAIMTFVITKSLLQVSVFIPAPLIALGFATWISSTIWADKGLILVKDKFGAIPTNFLTLSAIQIPTFTVDWLTALLYYTAAIVFVAAIESLLCSRMADRLSNNMGIPFNPNKELWGQGWVNIVVPLLNGFPHTGALARTATNIKLGALSPLAGIFKFVFKLLLAAYLASYLELVPMACIGGILLYVATGMVKKQEVEEVFKQSFIHISLMVYTACVVVLEDFLVGVLTAILLYTVCIFVEKYRHPMAMNRPKQSEN